jgi:RNA-binding protein
VQIGKEGVTLAVRRACAVALADHELIKVKLGQSVDAGREEIAVGLAQDTRAHVAQVLGRTFLLYKSWPPGKKRKGHERIRLPA